MQSGVEGSAGYVAMERVTGKLEGKQEIFALMHFGIMDCGAPTLNIKKIPGRTNRNFQTNGNQDRKQPAFV